MGITSFYTVTLNIMLKIIVSTTGLLPGWGQDMLYCKNCFLRIPKGQNGPNAEGAFAVFINSISYIYCIPNICGLYDKK